MSRSVQYQVPGLSQPNDQLCWWTCFKMLTLYHRNRGVSGARLRNIETHANAMALYHQNEGTSTEEIEEIARDLGFRLTAATLTGNALLRLMQQNGPLMYAGYWPAGGGHCVIFSGTDGSSISVTDPWDGAVAARYNGYISSYLVQDTALIYL